MPKRNAGMPDDASHYLKLGDVDFDFSVQHGMLRIVLGSVIS